MDRQRPKKIAALRYVLLLPMLLLVAAPAVAQTRTPGKPKVDRLVMGLITKNVNIRAACCAPCGSAPAPPGPGSPASICSAWGRRWPPPARSSNRRRRGRPVVGHGIAAGAVSQRERRG